MKRTLAFACLAALPLGFGGVLAASEPTAQIADDLDTQQTQLRQARLRAADARERAERLQGQAAEAQAEAERTAAQRAALEAEVEEAEAELAAATARLELLDARQAERLNTLATMQAPLVGLVAALQSFARRPSLLAISEQDDLADMVHLRAVMLGIEPVVERRTADIRKQIASGRQYLRQERLARRALTDSRESLALRRERLAELEANQRSRAQAINEEVQAERLRAFGLGERTRDIIESIEARDADASLAGRLAGLPEPRLRERQKAPEKAAPGRPPYLLPVQGQVVTGLGEATDYGFRAKGVTVRARPGSQVVAPAGGKVVFAGRYRSFGRIVIIDHGDGWTTLLTGLGDIDVSVGQPVRQGSRIGMPGDAHAGVTVELRRGGRPVDLVALLG